jgi:hypothetical protein
LGFRLPCPPPSPPPGPWSWDEAARKTLALYGKLVR